MNRLLVVTLGLLFISSVYANPMGQDEALDKAQSSCYFYNTACPLGAQIAFDQNSKKLNKKEKIASSIKSCRTEMDTDRRKISCLHGVQFFYTNLLGMQKLRKKAMKTIPFIVYTAGHGLGVSISLLNHISGVKNYTSISKRNCEEFSFDNDVLDRCHQGLKAFADVL